MVPAAAYLASSTTLIKSLKAAQDPPQPDFPSKIVIAREAWATQGVYVPRKAEVLREWVVESWTRVGKGKGKDVGTHPVLVPGYHQLFLDVSQSSQGASTSTVNLSPSLTILQSFFSLLTDAPGAGLNELVKLAQQSFTLLYPTNQTSYKAEAWADAWTAMVGFVASVGAGDLDAGAQQSLTSLVELVSQSTVTSLSGSQNRRKIAQAAFPTLHALSTSLRTHPYLSASLQAAFTPLYLPLPILQSHSPTPLNLILPSIPSSPLLLPFLLEAYISAVQSSRYTLFPPPTSSKLPPDVYVAGQVRSATQTALGDILRHVESSTNFEARCGIWTVIHSWGGYLEGEAGWTNLLASEGRRVERVLRDGAGQETEWVLRTCAVLVGLDHAAADVGEEVVGFCLTAPSTLGESSKAVLSSLITFHSLTHTVPAFFTLLSASIESLFTPVADSSKVYNNTANGILTSSWLATEAVRALRTGFVGGRRGRVWAEVVANLHVSLETAAESSKRRKVDNGAVDVASPEVMGLLSRLLRVVVNAGVDVEDATETATQAVETLKAWSSVPWAELLPKANGKKRKSVASVNDIELAARVRLARAVSRLLYASGTSPEDDLEAVVGALEASEGEAAFELAQWAVQILSIQALNDSHKSLASKAVDALLSQANRPASAWSGRVAAVTSATASVATWSLIAERGVALLDIVATAEQLASFAAALVAAFDESAGTGITAGAVIVRMLMSAEFWELARLRVALLETIRKSSALDDATALKAFAVAGYCPSVYLSKSVRAALVDAAYALDRKAVNGGLRRFLLRLAEDFGILGPLATDLETIKYFMYTPSGDSRTHDLLVKAFDQITADPQSPMIKGALDVAKASKPFSDVAKKLRKAKAVSNADVDAGSTYSLLLLTRLSRRSFEKQSPEVQEAVRTTLALVVKYLNPAVDAVLVGNMDASLCITLLAAWKDTLRIAKWADVVDTCNANRASALVTAAIDRHDRAFGVACLDAITAEMDVTDAAARSQLVLASYIVIAQHNGVSPALDGALAAPTTLDSYTRRLCDVAAAIAAPGNTEALTLALLQAAKVLVKTHVEGSGRVAADFAASVLLALKAINGSAAVTLSIMELVDMIVSERIVQIQLAEATLIWDLLVASMLPSSAPRTTTSRPEIIHHALNTVYTLARHRPDLVLATLPLITAFLASVFAVLQSPRAAIGGKVRARAVARWPAWIADGQELGDNEAKRFARVLTTLSSRSSRTAAAGSQDKISLSGPFAKHAPALLVAYVRAVADSVSGLSTAVRKELEPGLFALCEVITAGGRAEGREGEGVGEPFGLGEVGGDAEREVWADLWRRWGKERYVGQG